MADFASRHEIQAYGNPRAGFLAGSIVQRAGEEVCMITFKRILFPVDFSAESRAVAPSVKAMARRFGAPIVVMHVVDLPPTWFGSPEAASWAAVINADGLREAGQVGLNRFIEQEFAGEQVTGELAEGDAESQIVDFASNDPGTLIMMPTHGYSAFRALLLGSVTAKVLHDTHCPVWTGVHTKEVTAHSPQTWKRMLCALDTDDKHLTVLKWAAGFASEQGMELKLVHAVPGTNAPTLEENVSNAYKFLFDVAREQLARMQANAGTKLDICLLGGQAGPVVREAAVEHNVDLVVIGRGVMQAPLGRLRSRAYAIIREAPCPVISI
jgi:nucleotide-binding universal stress UspA family protein